MTAQADQAHANLVKLLAILIIVIGIAAVIWPLYRKFFVNEWRERIVDGEPVVFIPDCPVVSAHLRCGDRYTLVFRKTRMVSGAHASAKTRTRNRLNPAALILMRGILPDPGGISPSKAFGFIIPGEAESSSRPTRSLVG